MEIALCLICKDEIIRLQDNWLKQENIIKKY